MSNKSFNSQDWEIQCFYTNRKYDESSMHEISIDTISRIEINNSIEMFVPKIQIKFIDKGYVLINHLNSNGTILILRLVEPKQTPKQDPVNLIVSFIINDIQILTLNEQQIIFEVYGTHIYDIELSKNIIYANDKTQGKISPYKIISDVLSNNTTCIFDKLYKDTSQRIDMITSQNMRVKDIINYCLEMGVSRKDPPMYFLTRLLDSQCMLFNQYSSNESLNKPCNGHLIVYTDTNELNNSLANFTDKLISNMPNGGVSNLNLLSTYKFNDFNQNTRTWKQTIYNRDEFIDLLNPMVEDDDYIFMDEFFPFTKDQTEFIKSYSNFSQHKIYSTFRNLELGEKNIQFMVFGNLSRDCGQIVNLSCEKETLQTELKGPWFIYSCMHVWEGSTYINDLVCYRTFRLNPDIVYE